MFKKKRLPEEPLVRVFKSADNFYKVPVAENLLNDANIPFIKQGEGVGEALRVMQYGSSLPHDSSLYVIQSNVERAQEVLAVLENDFTDEDESFDETDEADYNEEKDP